MFGSAILDIAIGMVFVYLLLSLIVTAAQEVIESVIKLRAAHLAKGIQKLLGDDKARQFFDHALIKGLSPDNWMGAGTRKPSYIPSQTFAATVVDLIASAEVAVPRTVEKVQAGIKNIPDATLQKALTVLLEESGHKLDAFEASLETWFNTQMERVGGWYRRKVQLIILAAALVITVAMNADTLAIVKTLSNDSALRASLVAQAQEIAKQPPAPASQGGSTAGGAPAEPTDQIERGIVTMEQRIEKVQGLGLPVTFAWWRRPPADFSLAKAIPGWLLTALAISLGAPFWFDMLEKVVSIRSSGKAPDKKADAS